MTAVASQITSLTIVYLTIHSGTDQRKHQSSASLAFVRGIHQSLVNSPHKWPVTRKMSPFDDIIMGTDSKVPMRKKLATMTAHRELTVTQMVTASRDWAMTKWSQPAVTEPWPGPWLSCDLAVIILKMPWLSCDLAVTELWPSHDWAVISPWLSCDLS